MCVLDTSPCRTDSVVAFFLVLSQPRLLRLSHDALGTVVDKMAAKDEYECDRVHPVDVQVEDVQSNDDGPEVTSQETNVEEGGAGHAEDDRSEGVEYEQEESVAREVAADSAVPGRRVESRAIEDTGLHTVDDHAEERQLAQDFVHGTFRNEELFQDVADTVESRRKKDKQVTFDGVDSHARVCTSDVVGGNKNAKTSTADDDTSVLRDVIADTEEDERDGYDHDDGPERDQLGGEDRCVAVTENDKVVSLDIKESQDDVPPAILEDHARPLLEAVAVDGVAGVDEVEQHVVEEALECWDRGSFGSEERGEGVCSGLAESDSL